MSVLRTLSLAVLSFGLAFGAQAAGGQKHVEAPEEGWPFEGAFGEFDKDSLQRGYQVYNEVCSVCHSMKLLSYRNLGEPGGPFYDSEYSGNDNPLVKAFAANDAFGNPRQILKGYDEFGQPVMGQPTPADRFLAPFANDAIARAANGGALPPDLSVITKARHGGASYIYSLMTGYVENAFDSELHFPLESAGNGHGDDDHGEEYHGVLSVSSGQYYNPYMQGDTTPNWEGDPRHVPPGGFLAMPPQLPDGRVTYLDGTEATTAQMAADVAQFLAWAGEPKQVNRKSAGFKVIAFLTVLAILIWFSFHQLWRNVEH